MSNIVGISAGFHDAAISIIDDDGRILFAAHSERYSKKKNDPALDPGLLKALNGYGYSTIAWYERPWMRNIQQWRSGQRDYGPWTVDGTVKQHFGLSYQPKFYRSFAHHLSHAAAGFQTSTFDRAAVVVIDAIGELDTISIYQAWYDDQGQAQYKKMWGQRYPHSIGLFYSAVTKAVGLKPMDEEYITMGMAAYGSDLGSAYLMDQVITDPEEIKFYKNLHIGFDDDETKSISNEDFAAAAQGVTETLVMNVMRRARKLTGCENLVYMGGVALNCVANRRLGQIFDRIWIMPNPGDAGSSLGAAALAYGKKLQWRDAFLGHEIPGEYPVKSVLDELITNKIVGVASGRAEFGPRALGNRSLLADPRGPDIKDRVNEIKRRQKFRPFAPVILEELVDEYFIMPSNWSTSPYMQIVADVRRPDLYPAISHADKTARVQTVSRDGSGIRELLEQWYLLTGCPMLLNTSLNIRGEPMVNDRTDADRFEKLYGVRVCS
jgi:carbamoyltransferase